MADASRRDNPTTPLFYYTSEAALYSIVESKKFWFTSIYCMDNELRFGFDVPHSIVTNRGIGATAISEMFLRKVFDKDTLPKLKAIFEYYFVSFGQRDDAEQWKDYGDKERGIAFGVAPFLNLMEIQTQPQKKRYLSERLFMVQQRLRSFMPRSSMTPYR